MISGRATLSRPALTLAVERAARSFEVSSSLDETYGFGAVSY